MTIVDNLKENTDIDLEDEMLYRISGLDPANNNYHFHIHLNESFAQACKDLEDAGLQNKLRHVCTPHLKDTFNGRVRFKDDSVFLTSVVVAPQDTGITCDGETMYDMSYSAKNVDCSKEAIRVIALFETWVEFAKTVLVGDC